jgi:hypothetical protein
LTGSRLERLFSRSELDVLSLDEPDVLIGSARVFYTQRSDNVSMNRKKQHPPHIKFCFLHEYWRKSVSSCFCIVLTADIKLFAGATPVSCMLQGAGAAEKLLPGRLGVVFLGSLAISVRAFSGRTQSRYL